MEIETTCLFCGKKFIAKGKNCTRRKYCSDECREKHYNKKIWEKVKPPDPEPRQCLICGKVFVPDRSHPNAKTCSYICSYKYQNLKDKIRRAEKREKLQRKCQICGKIFKPNNYNTKYCSDECKKEAKRIRNRKYQKKLPPGEKTKRNYRKRWSGNYKLALERDGYKCVICGSEENLEVHHINGLGEKKGQNHRLENLITLCRKCHKQFHYVHLVLIDGRWYIKGEILSKLGLNGSIPIIQN